MRARLREDDLRKDFSPVFIVYVRRAFRESSVLLRGVAKRLSPITYDAYVKEKEEKGGERGEGGEEVTLDCIGVTKKKNIFQFREGLSHPEDHSTDPLSPKLVIIDDLIRGSSSNEVIVDLFTKGSHHKNLSVILIS